MKTQLYSVRMHASSNGEHLSGAETLVPENRLEAELVALLQRARQHPRGEAEQIRFAVDLVDQQDLVSACLPELRTLQVASVDQGRELAQSLLQLTGVTATAAQTAVACLASGASTSGQSMRGAMLVDAGNGARLEADHDRGVRVSRIGLEESCRGELARQLEVFGLNNPHVREALVLAGKVSLHPDILAELCWSDDPDYTTGYVCSPELGYLRIPGLKPVGETRGGRAFFLRPGTELKALVDWLEQTPVLFDRIGCLHSAEDGRSYAARLATAAG